MRIERTSTHTDGSVAVSWNPVVVELKSFWSIFTSGANSCLSLPPLFEAIALAPPASHVVSKTCTLSKL